MLLRTVKLENLLSFRNTEVELRGLNVLIGANASGKSNLIEAIGLLQAAPVDLQTAIRMLGGVHVVCSLAKPEPIAAIECCHLGNEALEYRLEFAEQAKSFTILMERFAAINSDVYFDRQSGKVAFGPESRGEVSTTQSVFEVSKNPNDPTPITRVGRELASIRIYREFRTGLRSQARTGVSTSNPQGLLGRRWRQFGAGSARSEF